VDHIFFLRIAAQEERRRSTCNDICSKWGVIAIIHFTTLTRSATSDISSTHKLLLDQHVSTKRIVAATVSSARAARKRSEARRR
jgi:hypothetical protein